MVAINLATIFFAKKGIIYKNFIIFVATKKFTRKIREYEQKIHGI